MSKIASIDIGSNTLRLLIAEKTETGFKPAYRDRGIVRLGRDFYPERRMSFQAIEAAISVLKRFKEAIDKLGAFPILAVGTGVLREATNTAFLLEGVKEKLGLSIRIISGIEEARIMVRGVLSVFPNSSDKSVIFDIGGGSTEVVLLKKQDIQDRQSLPLGVVGLTEAFLPSDPPSQKELTALRNYCRNILEKNLPGDVIIDALIGTAGTVTTLAAMAKKLTVYDPDLINQTILTREQLNGLFNEMASLPISRRALLPGLEAGRADIILSGLVLVDEILDFYRQERLLVSDAGLLEGLILEKDS